MAKGLRASTKKSSRSKLRSKVFGPIEDARTERLSTKLLELASVPRSSKAKDLKVDTERGADTQDGTIAQSNQQAEEAMDIDESSAMAASHKSQKTRRSGRVQKKRNTKPRNSITFPKRKSGTKSKFSKKH